MKYNRIMVVDKEASYGKELCARLEEAGDYKTARAGSIREAKEVARGFYPQLVVTDALLPDGDGYDLYTELRAGRPELPVLFLCADEDETARLRGLGIAADRRMTRREAKEQLAPCAIKLLQRVYERTTIAAEES